MTFPLTADHLYALANTDLKPDELHTRESIRGVVEEWSKNFGGLPEDQVSLVCRRLETKHQTTMEEASVLKDKDHKPWLAARMVSTPTPYWNRYRSFLEEERNLPTRVTVQMDSVLDNILDHAGDPDPEGNNDLGLDRRGLVVGQVQSGKTANYTGLICKAADAGYRVFIVIAGIHNNLRQQTQGRIDEGFVGRSSIEDRKARPIGAAKHHGEDPIPDLPTAFTDTRNDFRVHQGLKLDLGNVSSPSVFVIKKNPTVLKRLNDWLESFSTDRTGGIPLPAMIIDDEADNASIDVGRGTEPSTINGQIRRLLRSFSKSSYVGYTATPFANIFIDPETSHEDLDGDLFPESFIFALEPPSNYHGPERIFGDETAVNDHVRIADDYADVLPLKHKKTHPVTILPKSLEQAIESWFVATAIRNIRAGRENVAGHSTMMINVSRFQDVQAAIGVLVAESADRIKRAIKAKAAMPNADSDPSIRALHAAFNREYATSGHSWKQVLGGLPDLTRTEVKVINGRSKDRLDYSNEKNARYIAVGGLSLSRGLTLEGLTTSYFLRNSKMYDTLMQMGRWFGYRPNYEDLVRIWLTESSKGWYEHITSVITELRGDLAQMERDGGTPRDFGLKVLRHPDTLEITARNKMGSSAAYVHQVVLSNKGWDAYEVSSDAGKQRDNHDMATAWLESITTSDPAGQGSPISKPSGMLFRRVPKSAILKFLTDLKAPKVTSPLTDPRNLRRFFEDADDPLLTEWDVYVPKGEGRIVKSSVLGENFPSLQRKRIETEDGMVAFSSKNRIASPNHEAAGLEPIEIDRIDREYNATSGSGKRRTTPSKEYRKARSRPLFLLYFVTPDETGGSAEPSVAVTYGVSIPRSTALEKPVDYQVNQTYLEQLTFFDESEDSDEEEGEA